MAYEYTKTLPTPAAKKVGLDAVRSYFDHLPWIVQNLGSDFVSLTWDGTTLVLTVTTKLPALTEEHFGF